MAEAALTSTDPIRGARATRAPLVAAALAVTALLAVLYAGLRARSVSEHATGVNAVGAAIAVAPRPVPAITLGGFDGAPFRIADHRGRLLVVNFWASWCAPCRDEAPALQRAWLAHRDSGVSFVGVNLWDREPAARQFLQQVASGYPNAPDPAGEAGIAFGVRGLPETFFVDREGRIVRKWIGPIGERQIAATLAELGAPAVSPLAPVAAG